MLLFKRIGFLSLLLLLTACGFEPLHVQKDNAAVSTAWKDIYIPSIPDQEGQYLRNLLIDTIYVAGRPENARYELKILPLRIEKSNLGIQKDATITRTQIEITASVKLIERSTGKTLLHRSLRAMGGYDVLDDQYTTIVTSRNNTRHILKELSETIMTELNLYFRRAGDTAT